MAIASPAALAVVLVLAFLLGSIPWGVVIGKTFYHTDIRKVGSGNIGTTNAMRALGRKGGIAVFLLDFGKGVITGLIAMLVGHMAAAGSPAFAGSFLTYDGLLAVAFFGCITGHIFSPWLKFHGGKGIAVAVGALFSVFGPVGALIEIALFAVLVIATRYVSLGSVAAAVLCPFLAAYFFWGDWLAWGLCTLSALIVIWAHRENIHRLLTGTERRLGDKKEA